MVVEHRSALCKLKGKKGNYATQVMQWSNLAALSLSIALAHEIQGQTPCCQSSFPSHKGTWAQMDVPPACPGFAPELGAMLLGVQHADPHNAL